VVQGFEHKHRNLVTITSERLNRPESLGEMIAEQVIHAEPPGVVLGNQVLSNALAGEHVSLEDQLHITKPLPLWVVLRETVEVSLEPAFKLD
jgi:hypothetical protein